ncbi:MAG: hypothetical protein Q7S42_03355 [Candidatus Omnitrophota bacterium]|nr:hypothetical protein [Candidatus Omnitrophota bacterium]
MIKKGQAILEFALVFIIVTALIAGLLSLWEWSNSNIPSRQEAFEDTRVEAGSKSSAGQPAIPFNANSPPEPYLFRK